MIPPLGLRVCNYNKLLRVRSDSIASLRSFLCADCACRRSEHVYAPAKHVLTSDPCVFGYETVRLYLNKGASFRPIFNVRPNCLLGQFIRDLGCFVSRLACKYKIVSHAFLSWRSAILQSFISVLSEYT